MITLNGKMSDRSSNLSLNAKNYFDQGLGEFYKDAPNRLVLYPFLFSVFLLECQAFWLIWRGPSFFWEYMAFTTVYSLHKAFLYTLCIFAIDLLAHYVFPTWGAYSLRKVGRMWIIWSFGLAIGFILHRIMIPKLIFAYAPDIIEYFNNHPDERLSNLTLLLILIPYWFSVLFFSMWVALKKQKIHVEANNLLVLPSNDSFRHVNQNRTSIGLPSGILRSRNKNENGDILLAEISHISIEDHYCNIHYSRSDRLMNKLIRLPIKEMARKLPADFFIQIHRSHIVNLGHVAYIKKTGRNYRVVLKNFDVELPVSRSRAQQTLPQFRALELTKIRN